jgi:DNA-binding NtrC family response regulator
MTVRLPPLRERTGDIRLLAHHFLDLFSVRYDKRFRGFAPDALWALERYAWPGNVRELEHEVERCVVLTENGGTIGAQALSPDIVPAETRSALDSGTRIFTIRRQGEAAGQTTLRKFVKGAAADAEADYLRSLLASTGGRVGEAARIAGLSRRSLYAKMKAHRLTKNEFKPRKSRVKSRLG